MSDPALIRDPILEAATRALDNCIEGYQATAVLAAVTPLILEQAAKVVEDHMRRELVDCSEVAAAIRALKEQP
jgi:hypothetical protein